MRQTHSAFAGNLNPDVVFTQTQENHKTFDPKETTWKDTPEIVSKTGTSTTASPHHLSNSFDDNFHVFVWLNVHETNLGPRDQGKGRRETANTSATTGVSGLPASIEQALIDDLNEIDQFLTRRTSLADRLSYQGCPQLTRSEIYDKLEKDRVKITGVIMKDDTIRQIYEKKVALINAAELLFQFFIPPCFDGPTVKEYWGALAQILDVGF